MKNIIGILELVIISILLLLGIILGANKTIIIFFSIITALFFFPLFINFKNKFENDIFHYQFYSPLSLSFIVSIVFLIVNNTEMKKEISFMLYSSLIIFSLIYIITHLYTKNKYPEYYFKR